MLSERASASELSSLLLEQAVRNENDRKIIAITLSKECFLNIFLMTYPLDLFLNII